MKFSKYAIVLIFILASCTSTKKLVYFQGDIPAGSIDSAYKVRIYPLDILSITVFTINMEAYPYFNMNTDRSVADNRSAYEKGYVVDDSGQVKLPLIGAVKVSGLTISQARAAIDLKLRAFINDPIVTVKKLNFKVRHLRRQSAGRHGRSQPGRAGDRHADGGRLGADRGVGRLRRAETRDVAALDAGRGIRRGRPVDPPHWSYA